jgi:anthranilate synthase component 2
MHGKTSLIHHDGLGIFSSIPSPFEAIRYHSLAIDRTGLPDDLEVSAWTDKGVVMGVRHRSHPVEGVQFHPESIKTEHGKQLLQNFLDMPSSKRGRHD